MRISRKKETTNDDHRWMPLRSGALQHSFQAIVRASLLVSDCQHIGAGSGTVNVLFPSETVEAEGELVDYQSQADSGTLMNRQFCPSCGTPVFAQANTRPQYISAACARARLTILISATLKSLSGPQVRQAGPASIRPCRERKNRLRRANRLNR